MERMNTANAWLATRWALLTSKDWKEWRERGEGPVSYIAVVLLIAVIALAISQTGIGTTITGYIGRAVDQVWTNGTKAKS